MRRALLLFVLGLAGCPAPTRYAVDRPGIGCDRATRVAHRAIVEMGYTVTALRPALVYRPGEVAAYRTKPDGGTERVRVVIKCDANGAVLQPYEETLIPSYEFSRAFGYSFKSLVQRPDVEDPRAEAGLQVLVQVLTPSQAILDLDGVPTVPTAVPVRVTVRNNTNRAVKVDPATITLVAAGGDAASPLAGPGLASALAPGEAADRLRSEALRAMPIKPHTTVHGWLVYAKAPYTEARVSIEDVETGETEGFVAPVQ